MANNPRVSVKFEVNSTGYTAAVNKAKAQMVDFGAATKRVQHAAITDVQATSGALRLLDGGIQNNIRSAERFLASVKGVGAAVQAIYPLVGAIAVAAVIGRGVAEMVNFQKKAKEAGEQFRESWQEMVNSSRLGNDELAKTNIELENQIAKLEGKHENTLALELMQSRIEATRLAGEAENARDKIKQLFKEKGVGFGSLMGAYRYIIKGETPTDDVEKEVNGYRDRIAKAQQDRADALHGGSQSDADAAQKRYEDVLAEERGKLRPELADAQKMQRDYGNSNENARIAALSGELNLNYDATDRIEEEKQNKQDQAKLKRIEDDNKATVEMMKRYRNEYSKLQSSMTAKPSEKADLFHARELATEADFWSEKLALAKRGTEAYREIENELSTVQRESNQQYAAAQNEALELEKQRQKFVSESFGEDLDLSRAPGTTEGLRGDGADAAAMLDAMNKSVAIGRENADAWREAQIQIGLAAGTVSKYDAAMQTYQLHREQHARDLADIEAQRVKLEGRYGVLSDRTSIEGKAAYRDLGNQYEQANGGWMKQQAIDQQAITGGTPFGAWKQALNQFVQESRDTASQVRDIWSSALSGVNDEIVKVISTRHNYNTRIEFGNIGAGIFRNVAGAGLRGAEGSVLHALGLGGGKKPTGAKGDPLYVAMTGIAGAASGAANSIGGVVGKAAGGIGGLLGKIGSIAGSVLSGLGFADGGMPPVGMASLVGERGPELFVPSVAGSIIPNDQLGGGDTHHHWNIDARGNPDPSQTIAIVRREITRSTPQIAAATTHAQQSGKLRMPSSRRS